MDNQFVSIIIPTFRDWSRLSLCIDALSKQSYPTNKFEVVIVNNDPHDPIPDNLVLPETFKIISENKPGSYAARNAALSLVNGDIVGFTDSDCIPDSNWIKNAVDYFEKNKSCTRIAGNVSVFAKSPKATIAEQYDKLHAFKQRRYVKDNGTCVTANLFAYKYVFDKVGLFNDKQMSYGDLDWGINAHKIGYRIDYVENVVINHPARDLPDLIKKEKRLAGGREKVTKKYSRFAVYYKFLKEVRPRFNSEFKAIKKKGKNLTFREKLLILFLRFRLQYVRAFETMKLRLGKKPNRE